jgi:predicted PurR-regulated permease PerM
VDDGATGPAVPRALPLWLTVVLGLAGATVAVWGVHAARGLLGPVALACVLTVVAHPSSVRWCAAACGEGSPSHWQ